MYLLLGTENLAAPVGGDGTDRSRTRPGLTGQERRNKPGRAGSRTRPSPTGHARRKRSGPGRTARPSTAGKGAGPDGPRTLFGGQPNRSGPGQSRPGSADRSGPGLGPACQSHAGSLQKPTSQNELSSAPPQPILPSCNYGFCLFCSCLPPGGVRGTVRTIICLRNLCFWADSGPDPGENLLFISILAPGAAGLTPAAPAWWVPRYIRSRIARTCRCALPCFILFCVFIVVL